MTGKKRWIKKSKADAAGEKPVAEAPAEMAHKGPSPKTMRKKMYGAKE